MNKVTLSFAVLSLAACHSFRGKEFTGSYRHEGDAAQQAPGGAGFSKISVRDPRPEPQLVGDQSREDRAGSYPLTMLGDVGGWVREGFAAQAKAAGFAIGASQNPSLTLTVNNIDMHEQVSGNANYRARIVLDAQLVLANGEPCLTASYEGDAKNFGSDASPDNYRQTLNRALDAVSVAMMNAGPFRDAASGRCPGGPTPPPPPPPVPHPE